MCLNYHLIVTLPIYVLVSIGLFGLFKKAGEQPWKAFVPVLNLYTWLKMIGRPAWWLVLFFIPVVNLVMNISICLDMARVFGKNKFWEQALAVIFPFALFPYIAFNKTDKFLGTIQEVNEKNKLKLNQKSEGREWLDAVLFAGTAALIIRVMLLEAFMIPTTSMEGSLLAGDFLFVSKAHYGIRMPSTPFSLPFVHNTIPGTSMRSFLDFATLPYCRLPKLKEVERFDIVVFNYPGDDEYPDVPELGPIKPVTMKQNYIKRCVAISGDTLEIIAGDLHINGKLAWKPENLQNEYEVITKERLKPEYMNENGFRFKNSSNDNVRENAPDHYTVHTNDERAEFLRKQPFVASLKRVIKNKEETSLFTQDPKYMIYPKKLKDFPWNEDNFGPIWIPKKGATIPITRANVFLYRRCIEGYEGHDMKIESGKCFIDGEEVKEYTFEMDYYFMMGDNRHSSLDSRFWGFVPEDHIVGRPLMVMTSFEGGPRWERSFNAITRWEP